MYRPPSHRRLAQPAPIAPNAGDAHYARVSTQRQAVEGSGLPAQFRSMAASDRGERAVVEYTEDASGTRINRPTLAKLRADARAGKVARIRFHSPDRLARNVRDGITLVEEWQKLGIQISFSIFPFDNSPAAWMQLINYLNFAAFEAQMLRDRIKRSWREKALSGYYPRRPAYGWRRAEKRGPLSLDPEQAPIVVRVFEHVAARGSLRTIANALNREGIRSRFGGPWHVSSLAHLIRTDSYLGTAYFHREEIDGVLPGAGVNGQDVKQYKLIHERDWLAVPVPPIVSPALWRKANAVLDEHAKERSNRGARPTYVTLIRGIARCADCDARIYSVRTRPRSPRGRASIKYSHDRHSRKPGCRLWWAQPDVDAAVRQCFVEYLSDPERAHAEYRKREGVDAGRAASELRRLEAARAKAKGRQDIAIDLRLSGKYDEAMLDRKLGEIAATLATLDGQIATTRGLCHQPMPAADLDVARELHALLADAPVDVLAGWLRMVCPRVRLARHEAVVELLPDQLRSPAGGTLGIPGRGMRTKCTAQHAELDNSCSTQAVDSPALLSFRVALAGGGRP